MVARVGPLPEKFLRYAPKFVRPSLKGRVSYFSKEKGRERVRPGL